MLFGICFAAREAYARVVQIFSAHGSRQYFLHMVIIGGQIFVGSRTAELILQQGCELKTEGSACQRMAGMLSS